MGLVMDCVSPQKSYVESLTPSVAVLRAGASKEVMKDKWDDKGEGVHDLIELESS